jgi:hypothetical protein
LCGVIPVATVLGAFVTPHSAQLLLSVLLCAVAIDVIEAEVITRRHFVRAIVVTLVVIETVPHALVGVAIAALAIVIGRRSRSLRPRRSDLVGAAMLVTGAVAYEGWLRLVSLRTTAFTETVNQAGVSVLGDTPPVSPLKTLVEQWWHFWPGALAGDDLGYGPWEHLETTGMFLLAAAGVGALLMNPGTHRPGRLLALAMLIVAPIAALGATDYFTFPVPLRYGSSVVGISLLLVAFALRSRAASNVLLALTSLLVCASFFSSWP